MCGCVGGMLRVVIVVVWLRLWVSFSAPGGVVSVTHLLSLSHTHTHTHTHTHSEHTDGGAAASGCIHEGETYQVECMNVCMCVSIYTRVCICVCSMYVCMHVCACLYVCAHVHVCMHVCACVCTCVHVCMYVCMYVCMQSVESLRQAAASDETEAFKKVVQEHNAEQKTEVSG